jgi:hypothetical protein
MNWSSLSCQRLTRLSADNRFRHPLGRDPLLSHLTPEAFEMFGEAASHGREAIHYRVAGCLPVEGLKLQQTAGPQLKAALAAPVGESGARS